MFTTVTPFRFSKAWIDLPLTLLFHTYTYALFAPMMYGIGLLMNTIISLVSTGQYV